MLNIIIYIVYLSFFTSEKALMKAFAEKVPVIVRKIEFSTVSIYNKQKKITLTSPINLLRFFKLYLSVDKINFPKTSLGSGFIIDEYSHIITNYHVVENAENIGVIIGSSNKYKYQARIIGKDKKTDLALLKINGINKQKFIRLGDSDECRVGQKIVAIGNSYGFKNTVTTGIVSAKERKLGNYFYEEFIQTDASINRGNSGGPMVNLKGEVIGVNSAIISPNGGNVGMGFAIPSNTVKYIISKLFIHGKIYRPWLGIKFRNTYIQENIKNNLLSTSSIKINMVIKNSPAEKAGLKKEDLILSYNNTKININTNFTKLVSNSSIKDDVLIKLIRKNKILTYIVRLEIPKKKYIKKIHKKIMFLGITVTNINKYTIITKISNICIAKKRGIKTGDIILSINKNNIHSLINLNEILKQNKDEEITLLIIRNKKSFFVTI